MTAPGIDTCSLVPLYIEAFFGDQLLGGATAFPWLRLDGRLSLLTNWHVVSGRNNETYEVTHTQGGIACVRAAYDVGANVRRQGIPDLGMD